MQRPPLSSKSHNINVRSFWLALTCSVAMVLAGCDPGDSSATAALNSDCDQGVVIDKKTGEPVLPPEATEVSSIEYVEEDLGLLSDLYPDMDTNTDGFYSELPCEPSIGGTLPPEEPPSADDLEAEAFVAKFEEQSVPGMVEALTLDPAPPVSLLNAFTMGNCYLRRPGSDALLPEPCNSDKFLDNAQPFGGRDIIYVHGLATQHISDKLQNPPSPSPMVPSHPSNKLWPQDATAFTDAGGYYRTYAEDYWRDHIREHLGMGWQYTALDAAPVYVPKANRYLLIAWSSNQTMEYAQHAMLTQIQQAIMTNKNVVTPSAYPTRFVRPFCSNGCMVISHSTGSPITTSAMALADFGFYGAGGREIPQHIAAHISFAGAISGSRLATIAMALALSGAPVAAASNGLCDILDWMFDGSNTCNADTSFIANSILRDLIPMVAQNVWGPWIQSSPVPTVTSAGGHPVGGFGITGFMLPGIDDGVVTMNSACGNPNPVLPGLLPPSGLTVSSLTKAFEMTEGAARLLRSSRVFVNQKNLKALAGPRYLAGTCTPWLSPTGMVMPVALAWADTPVDARKRFRNHYSFIQGLAEHSYDGGSSTANPWPSAGGFPASENRHYLNFSVDNVEESNAATDAGLFTRYIDGNGTLLAKPIGTHEIVRGRKLSYRMPFRFKNCTRRGPANYFCQVWVWKRTYHLLDKWQEKQSSHYAYEFVGRRI